MIRFLITMNVQFLEVLYKNLILTRIIVDPEHISADITEENLELGHSAATSRLLSSAVNR